ncbi:MAG: polysaccharide deacetylase family protein [Pseudomonadota bacterium]
MKPFQSGVERRRFFQNTISCAVALLLLSGCAAIQRPAVQAEQPGPQIEPAAFASAGPLVIEAPVISGGSKLAGRTLTVQSIGDIQLGDKEVVLTFDDGPVGGRTDSILTTLDRFGVKATFLMVGQMASARPAQVRKVAKRGHSIGSHTMNHPNLARMSFDRAVAEIRRGEAPLRAAGINPTFFRFPYLADTQALRNYLSRRGIVVLDADIDSKDYFKVSPAAVAARTMRTLRQRGKGIILMHDLHARTATMLPDLLRQMEREGYKVVHLQSPQQLQVASR